MAAVGRRKDRYGCASKGDATIAPEEEVCLIGGRHAIFFRYFLIDG